MPEPIPATIEIGGELAADQLAELFAAASEDGVTAIDGAAIADEGDLEALINGSEPLSLVDPDASYGSLPALEATCEALGLTFRRYSDAKYEYEAEIVSWAPGMAEPRRTAGSQSGNAMISISAVRRLLDAPATSTVEVVARLREEVARRTPVDVPPLTIVAAAAAADDTAAG